MNHSLTRTNRPNSTFQFTLARLARVVRSPRLDSHTYPLVTDTDSRAAVCSLTVLSGEERGLGNNILILNMKRFSAERNLVNVMLIDDHLHHCTIVIRLRMRTREELSLTDSAENDRMFQTIIFDPI